MTWEENREFSQNLHGVVKPLAEHYVGVGLDYWQMRDRDNKGNGPLQKKCGVGGMDTAGQFIVRGAKKPISTLGPQQALESVDLNTKESSKAGYERSDACAVPAASVILENVVAFEIARAFVEKFAGDSMVEMRSNYERFMETARRLPL